MSVVIISAASYTDGTRIAERSAQLLGYEIVGREILAATSRQYGLAEERLRRAIHERARWRAMSVKDRKVCIAAIAATLSDRIIDGSCLCCGLAAHLYVTGISHVLKARINGPMEARVSLASQRNNLGRAGARRLVLRLDRQRRRWVRALFDIDEEDPARFDLVIDRSQAGIEEAAERIVDTARQRRYEPMSYSLQQARSYALECRVRAQIARVDPDADVRAEDGTVHITTTCRTGDSVRAAELRTRALEVPEVAEVDVTVVEDVFAAAATSMR